ncbi:MAG TPA: ice-binding family protein, partial [Candidatus Limnocylindria bacterium]
MIARARGSAPFRIGGMARQLRSIGAIPATTDARAKRTAVQQVGKSLALMATLGIALILSIGALVGSTAYAAGGPTVNLGAADSFAVLAGSGVTNTGSSVINGNVGSFGSSTSVGGFPPGLINGTNHGGDGVTQNAKLDLVTAYDDAAGRTPVTTIPTELGGSTQIGGTYGSAAGTFQITGNLTLNGQGDSSSVFIFKTASTLITAGSSSVTLINGAQACNVFWQVGSSATLGGSTQFVGNILALTSITLVTGATMNGRALARNGAVTLDTNVITRSVCAAAPAAATPAPTASPTPSATPSPTAAIIVPAVTPAPAPTATPTPPVAVLPAQTLPSTSTLDGSTPFALAGIILVAIGALILRPR